MRVRVVCDVSKLQRREFDSLSRPQMVGSHRKSPAVLRARARHSRGSTKGTLDSLRSDPDHLIVLPSRSGLPHLRICGRTTLAVRPPLFPAVASAAMRVWAVSDLHTDYAQNLEWVRQLVSHSAAAGSGAGGAGNAAAAAACSKPFGKDVILLAGDISDALDTLTKTLELFASAFGHVFFVPGNHDLWVRRQEREQYDSLQKLRLLQSVCKRLDVHTEPACIEGVWIFPLLSWYHAGWDREPDVPGSTPIKKVMVRSLGDWTSAPQLSSEDDSLARHFDELNEPAFSAAMQRIEAAAAAAGGARPPIISFSHFLPRQELLPEKRMLYYPNLAKASGSDWLEERIRRLRPVAHVFGHTHFSWDAEVDGVRYVQWPLGYPQEQGRRRNGGAGWMPLVLYDSEAGGLAPQRSCYWSDYYSMHPRNPMNVCKAPWVSG